MAVALTVLPKFLSLARAMFCRSRSLYNVANSVVVPLYPVVLTLAIFVAVTSMAV